MLGKFVATCSWIWWTFLLAATLCLPAVDGEGGVSTGSVGSATVSLSNCSAGEFRQNIYRLLRLPHVTWHIFADLVDASAYERLVCVGNCSAVGDVGCEKL
ncbi:hypothetical protein PF008_g10611 [Phytophthora fragariae]|uniref:RxLR effector protein n=1 Tax=Phytophthora fragariae TaxID=53985 RepID=A0A6G0RTQ7_9STRA|nr:hypothetical protein PF008_g10611 [Phytophthora fragariae]